MEMISLQSLLVDGIPCHVKDLRPRFSFTAPEENSDSASESDNVSESRAESLLFDRESAESDDPPQEEAEAVSPSCPCKEMPVTNKRHLVATFVIRSGCNENNDLPRNPKRARTCFACEARKYS